MKKKYVSYLLILGLIITSRAQVSTFLDITTNDISISGDDLYYVNDKKIYKVDISDLDFPVTSLVFDSEIEPGFDEGDFISSLKIVGDDLYFADAELAGLDIYEDLYSLDISDVSASPILIFDGTIPSGISSYIANIDIQSVWIYLVRPSAYGNLSISRANTSGTLPTTLSTYIDRETTALTISSGSMYFSESIYTGGTYSNGEIFFKNMILDLPEVSKFTTNGIVHDLYLFEGLLYFTDDDGLKLINPALVAPVSELLVSNTDYGNLQKIEVKSYVSGDKYLFVTDAEHGRVLKVDLNDETLSLQKNKFVKSKIFPNPARESIKIEANYRLLEAKLYDMSGKIILNKKNAFNTQDFNMNLSSLTSGLYTLKIITEKNNKYIKIIKK